MLQQAMTSTPQRLSEHAVAPVVLPQKDLSTARDVLMRILVMGFAPGVVLGLAFLVAQSAIPAVFTSDPGVISAVTRVVPLLALAMVRTRGRGLISCSSTFLFVDTALFICTGSTKWSALSSKAKHGCWLACKHPL